MVLDPADMPEVGVSLESLDCVSIMDTCMSLLSIAAYSSSILFPARHALVRSKEGASWQILVARGEGGCCGISSVPVGI